MASTRALALLIASLTVLAGCLGGTEDGLTPTGDDDRPHAVEAGWWNGSIPWGEEHDHADYSQHENLTTANFQVLGYDPLVTEAFGTTATGMGCGGTGETDEGRRIAVAHSLGTEIAFVVADITDPANPVKLGEYLLPNAAVWDATVTPDGLYVLVGADLLVFSGRDPTLPPIPPGTAGFEQMVERVGAAAEAGQDGMVKVQPIWRDACTGQEREAGPEQYLPLGGSLVMVGLQDPTDPTLEDVVPQPVIGPHSVGADLVQNRTIATSSVTNLVHEASYYSFYEIAETPAGGKLVPLSVIQAPGVQSPALNGHIDVEIQEHPGTGQVLAYLANWNDGVAIYDMTDPRVPQQVGHWADTGEHGGSIHEVLPLGEMRDGRHYSIAGQEVGEQEELPSGLIYILDTTDPANPEEVARWTIPEKPVGWPGLMFSTHYVEVVGDTLFVSNYHGGLWAVDIADVTQPRAVGHFVPDRASPQPHENAGGPNVEDVIAAPDGTLTVWDGNAGIYQLAFDAGMPAAQAPNWPGLQG